MNSYLDYLECSKCGTRYSSEKLQNSCACKGQLMAIYDLDTIKKSIDKNKIKRRIPNMWRYRELLPIKNDSNIISFNEGFTPIIHLKVLAENFQHHNIFLKDEGRLPGASFKARGASVGVSKAVELGVKAIAIPTAGNAGGAWAAYGARAGIEVHVVMPIDAPEITKYECLVMGAQVYLVDGLISKAGEIVSQACEKFGWFSIATFNEPYRLEGKKTLGLEIAEQFEWTFPDVILYPCGGGVGLVGIWKAFKELKEIGWVNGNGPRMVAVQSDECAPVVKAFLENKKTCEFWPNANSIADGLRVPKPLADTLILNTIKESNGCAVAVKEKDIPSALLKLAQLEGLMICPEAAATVLAANTLLGSGWIKQNEKILIINTASGLKYSNIIKKQAKVLKNGEQI
jgi:threonine synthase